MTTSTYASTSHGEGAPGVDPEVLLRQLDHLPDDLRRLAPSIRGQVRNLLEAAPWAASDGVYLTGAGDSHAAACAAEMAFETLAALPCEPLAAHRFVEYACPAMHLRLERPIVIAASTSGSTPRVVEAIQRARAQSALTLAITGHGRSQAAAAADASIVVDLANQERSPGVRTYQASLLAMLLLAVELGAVRGLVAPKDLEEIEDQLEAIATAIAKTNTKLPELMPSHVEAVAQARAAVIVGSGPNFGTALFAAAKFVEAAGIFAVAQDLDEWWHIERRIRPLEIPLFIVAAPGRSQARARDVAAAAHALGRKVIVVANERDERAICNADVVLPILGDVREEFSPLLYHLFAASTAALVTERLGRRLFDGHPPDFPKTLDGFSSRTTAHDGALVERVLDVLGRHIPQGVGVRVQTDTELTELGLDSLALVELIVDLEETFAIAFSSDALEPATFHTAGTIADAIATAGHIGPESH